MRRALFIGVCLTVAAAAPAGDIESLIRRANAAFASGDFETAESLYAAAEEQSRDPGLVAFNKAAVLFEKQDYYPAEVHYSRALDDAACPRERAWRAWFNRGSCLLRRGGSADVYRSAVACFENCLELKPADEPLVAEARRNLELAKLLWLEENRKAAQPRTPNSPPPEELPETPMAGTEAQPGEVEPGMSKTGSDGSRQSPGLSPQQGKKGASPGDTATAGNNPQLQPILDTDQVAPLSPEETRRYLQQTEDRLRRERQGLLRTIYGPDRPGVKDW